MLDWIKPSLVGERERERAKIEHEYHDKEIVKN